MTRAHRPCLFVTLEGETHPVPAGCDSAVLGEIKRWVFDRSYFRLVRSYDTVELRVHSLPATGRLLPSIALLPALASKGCVIVDSDGNLRKVGLGFLTQLAFQLVWDLAALPVIAAAVLVRLYAIRKRACTLLDLGRRPLYMRTDWWLGVMSGGSVGHIAGVVNNLDAFCGEPVFVTTDRIPTVSTSVEQHIIRPDGRHRNLGELRQATFNAYLDRKVRAILGDEVPSFIYQRYSLDNFSGLELAAEYGVPFVLEYNGSEVWMARHWGRPLRYEKLAGRIETANLRGADLIVVVSKAMRDELVGRGIDDARILVNPNGVDTEAYSPDVDGSEVRREYGLAEKTVVGFIWTFGRWHGAEVLAEAFGRLIERRPDLRDQVRLLMVGDGLTMPEVKANLERHGVTDLAVLTGLVPQARGPAHLAACDILASPHVPNADGTPFFGSPTKLFEYMAMGKAIVASDLDQIGEVLENDRTALMVEPGDVDALADGLERLVRDPALRARLGYAARERAVAQHTWREHTHRIVAALEARCREAS